MAVECLEPVREDSSIRRQSKNAFAQEAGAIFVRRIIGIATSLHPPADTLVRVKQFAIHSQAVVLHEAEQNQIRPGSSMSEQ